MSGLEEKDISYYCCESQCDAPGQMAFGKSHFFCVLSFLEADLIFIPEVPLSKGTSTPAHIFKSCTGTLR